MEREAVLQNIAEWRQRIGDASARWGGAEICAVTKTVDVDTINCAREGGIRTIGENRVQELMGKLDALNPEYSVHLIGSLQLNKVKYVIGHVDMIQSLDRDALAEEISRRAVRQGCVMRALVQVNIAQEPQKGGIDERELPDFIRRCSLLPGLELHGLMGIMPAVDDPELVRPYFRRMRAWFDRLRDEAPANVRMDTLSMGMSSDCIVAAQEGATMVRLGRALFGARPNKI